MPKNIVLLSDGTGNSAAQLFKTNVWRIYDALDLRSPEEQVACYDDGVGTSAFRPLAMLGGAIGFGLKRNVLRLYRFLCEQYEPGDRIYGFGFSRGAFTIRVLMALVADQGIIRVRADKFVDAAAPSAAAVATAAGHPAAGVAVADAPVRTTMTGSELQRLSRRAYQHFRHSFDQTLPIVWVGRWLRDHGFDRLDRLRNRTVYACEKNHQLKEGEITFVGVWDTVDAYGLPVDELTEGVNRWLWPLSLPELALSDKVGKACHAVSLDDERHTFHPVLWDEFKERPDENGEERVLQVWFAGAHANVGGGYPNDALSAVSLAWMADEAGRKKLCFLEGHLKSWTERRDPLGAAYDSRRGMASYYRYSPRRIEHLTNGQVHEQVFRGGRWPQPKPIVRIARPKIHESVFERIKAAPDFYGPIALPERYAVVTHDGRVVDSAVSGYEPADRSTARVRAQEVIWDLVWLRRAAYFATVALTVGLLAWPLRDGAEAVAGIAASGGGLRLIGFIGGFLPESASPWVNYYAAAPLDLACWLGMLTLTLVAGRKCQSRIRDHMHTIWRWVLAPDAQADLRLPEPGGPLYRLRHVRYYHGVFAVFRRIVVPNTFGPLLLLAVLAGFNRAAFEGANVLGTQCRASGTTVPVGAVGVEHRFPTSSFCAATGLRIERGAQYELTTTFEGAMDDTVPVTRADGFGMFSPGLTVGQRALFGVGLPFKRLWRADWFAVVARVGAGGVEQLPLAATTTRFTARNTGELFLFVNDAIVPVRVLRGAGSYVGWGTSYRNNGGMGRVTITRVG